MSQTAQSTSQPTTTLTPTVTATPIPPLRDDSLLHDTSLITPDPACLPPCWHGITPGRTSWQDALTLLENDPLFENVTVQKDTHSAALVAGFQPTGGIPCCQIFTQAGKTVSVIFMRVAPEMTIGQLIRVQGKPAYVIGSPFSADQAIINLIYPKKALVVYVFVAGTRSALSDSSEIIGVLYMTHADMELLLRTSYLHAWGGYKSYQAYDTGGYEVTPSITLTPTPP